MFPGAWCGQMGVAGWILMGIFWATFLGLVLWALSRLFAGPQRDDGVHEDLESPDTTLSSGSGSRRQPAPGLDTRSNPNFVRSPATDPVVEVRRDQEKEHDMSEESPKVTDPICGMSVAPATAASVTHEGQTYYFCGKGCAKSFSAEPGKYTVVTHS